MSPGLRRPGRHDDCEPEHGSTTVGTASGSEHPVKICREVDSPMCKLNWDVYHMQIMEGDLCRRLRELGPSRLRANHDNPGRKEPERGNCILAGLSGWLGLQQTR